MSRIGKAVIVIPDKVKVTLEGSLIRVNGPKGSLSFPLPEGITIEMKENKVAVLRSSETKAVRSLHGLVRAYLNNMVIGVSTGFEKTLELTGVGYRAAKEGKKLVLQMGYSHPIEVVPPAGVEFEVEKQTKIFVRGADKERVGQIAAEIRSVRPVEPYKGKGIKYTDEYVRRKAGKAAKTATAA